MKRVVRPAQPGSGHDVACHSGIVATTGAIRTAASRRWLATLVGVLLLAVASGCGSPPQPIDESVLLPLPDGYVVVDDSLGYIFECEHSCWRRWHVAPAGAPPAADHLAVVAAHVEETVGKPLRLTSWSAGSVDPAGYYYSGKETWISVRPEAGGLIAVSFNDFGERPSWDEPILGLFVVVLAAGLPVMVWSIRDDRKRGLHGASDSAPLG